MKLTKSIFGPVGSLPLGSLSFLTILFCAYIIMRSCNICFVSEWWNVTTNALCLFLPLVAIALVMGAYTTWQHKALACLFLFPIVLLCTAAFCIYSPRWMKIILAPESVPPPFKCVEHGGDTFVVYKNDARRVEVNEEKLFWIFKLKRYVAGNSNSDDVIIDFPSEGRVSCTFLPGRRKFIVDAHGSFGSGLLETLGFRRK